MRVSSITAGLALALFPLTMAAAQSSTVHSPARSDTVPPPSVAPSPPDEDELDREVGDTTIVHNQTISSRFPPPSVTPRPPEQGREVSDSTKVHTRIHSYNIPPSARPPGDAAAESQVRDPNARPNPRTDLTPEVDVGWGSQVRDPDARPNPRTDLTPDELAACPKPGDPAPQGEGHRARKSHKNWANCPKW
jgi:hypothetical protein